MGFVDILGWSSSALLVVTLVHQVSKQWREGKSEGVSIWLYIGQIVTSLGFFAYSVLVRNWVYAVTNVFLIASSVAGILITRHHRNRSKRAA